MEQEVVFSKLFTGTLNAFGIWTALVMVVLFLIALRVYYVYL